MDADGLWKAVDGFEAQQKRTRPPLPKPLQNRQMEASFPQRLRGRGGVVVIRENGACFENRISRISLETACHAEGPGGKVLKGRGPKVLKTGKQTLLVTNA